MMLIMYVYYGITGNQEMHQNSFKTLVVLGLLALINNQSVLRR